MTPPAADVDKLESDSERGIYFMRSTSYVPKAGGYVTIQCGSHVTRFTPRWCEVCGCAVAEWCDCDRGVPVAQLEMFGRVG